MMKLPHHRRAGERGNVFTIMLAAVGLAGLLGVVTYNLMSGPLATMSRMSTKGITDGELTSAARILILDAATQNNGGDCDADDYIEPRGWMTSNIKPTNGGMVPTDIGAPAVDAWGTPIGYCVWDIGGNDGNCGVNGANRLQGTTDPLTGNTDTQTVLAVFSAGPDRLFQSSCAAYTNGTTAVTTRSGDDTMQTFSYAEAAATTSAIWKLKSGDAATAQLLDDTDAAIGANISFDESIGKGSFSAVSADGKVTAGGGAIVGEPTTCAASDEGLIRYAAGSGGGGGGGGAGSGTLTKVFKDVENNSALGTTLTSTAFDSTGYDYVVVFTKHEQAPTTITMTDNKGSTFTGLTKQNHGGGSLSTQMFWAPIGTPGSGHTVTMTLAAARTWRWMTVWLVDTDGDTLSLDVETGATGGVNTAANGGNLVTTARTVLFMGTGISGTVTHSFSAGWTEDADNNADGAASRAEAAAGTFNATDTLSATANWAVVAAAFKTSGGGGNGTGALSRAFATQKSAAASGTTLTSDAFDSTGYDHIVVLTKYEGAATTVGVTDNKGTTFTPLTNAYHDNSNGGGAVLSSRLFYGTIGTPGAGHTFTMTLGAGRQYRWEAAWLVDTDGDTLVLDSETTNFGGVNKNVNAGNLVTTTKALLFMGSFVSTTATTHTFSAGWTEDIEIDDNAVASRLENSAGTFNATDTLAVNNNWTANAVSFRSDPAGGGSSGATIEYCDGTDWNVAGSSGGGAAGGGKWTRATDDIYYDTGAVNIGTQVVGTTSLMRMAGSQPKMSVRNISDCGDSCGGTFNLYRARGTASSPLATATGDVLGMVDFQAYGTSYVSSSQLKATALAASGSNTTPTKLEFNVMNDQGNMKTAATLTPTGLGLGTASPSERLHIATGVEAPASIGIVQTIPKRQLLNSTAAPGNASAAAFGSNLGAGNTLIVVASCWKSSANCTLSIADSRGHTWASQSSAAGRVRSYVFYATNTTAGADTITLTVGATATYVHWGAFEVSGLVTSSNSNMLDITRNATCGACPANVSLTNNATTYQSAFAVAVQGMRTNDTNINFGPDATNANGWTQPFVQQDGVAGGLGMAASYNILSSAYTSGNAGHVWVNDAAVAGAGFTLSGGQVFATFKGSAGVATSNSNVIEMTMFNATAATANEINFKRKRDGNIVVEQNSGVKTATNANSSNLTLANPPAPGNTIIVTVSGRQTAGDFDMSQGSVVDNQGNTYNLIDWGNTYVSGGAGTVAYIYAAYNIQNNGGNFTITADPGDSDNYMAWSAMEVSGIDLESPLDVSSGSSGSGASSVISTGSSTTQANELVVAVDAVRKSADTNVNMGHDGAWTETAVFNDSVAAIGHSTVYKIVSATGVQSHTWTHDSTTQGFSTAIATFRSANNGSSVLANGNVVGSINFMSYDGNSSETTARVQGIVNTATGGAVSTTNMPVDLSFQVGTSTSGLTERMRIDSRGYVGINRTPDVRLDINTGMFLNYDGGNSTDAPGVTGAGKRVLFNMAGAGFIGGELTAGGGFTNAWNSSGRGFAYGTDVDRPISPFSTSTTVNIGKNLPTANAGVHLGENFTSTGASCVVIGKNTRCGSDRGSIAIGNNVTSARGYESAIGNNITAGATNHRYMHVIGNNVVNNMTGGIDGGFYVGLKSAGSSTMNHNTASVMGVDGGNWGIGTVAPAHPLDVVGVATNPNANWTNVSDLRLKNILGPYDRGLDEISALETVRFRYKKDNPLGYDAKTENIGFIAQDVQPVFPEAVSMRRDGYLDFNMHSISVAMINALKELNSQNAALRLANAETRMQNEKARTSLNDLRTRLAALESKEAFFQKLRRSPWTGLWLLPLAGFGLAAAFRLKKGGRRHDAP